MSVMGRTTMLKLTDQQTGQTIWVNAALVSALLPARQAGGKPQSSGSVLLLSGGFEVQVREEPADVSAQLDKRLQRLLKAGRALTAIDEPGDVDAFGVRFTIEERGHRVRCHIFRVAIDAMADHPSGSDRVLLDRFQKTRALFEWLASDLYGGSHRNHWIGGVVKE